MGAAIGERIVPQRCAKRQNIPKFSCKYGVLPVARLAQTSRSKASEATSHENPGFSTMGREQVTTVRDVSS